MSRFYASIQETRGAATRQGSKTSGITSHTQGWNLGIKVIGSTDPTDRTKDQFHVYLTSGSNGASNDQYIGRATLTEDGFLDFIQE